jgi:membrane fusion protein
MSSSASPLFRPEAVAAQQAQWLGTVRLHRPWSYSAVTAVAVAMAASLIAFAVWGQVNRKTTATGLLMPTQGLMSVSAQAAGTVTERRVTEGQHVQAGDVLFVIDSARRSAIGDTGALVARQIEARAEALDAEGRLRESQARERRSALAERLASLNREIDQQASEIELQTRRVALALRTLERHQQLAREAFLAEAAVQEKQELWIDADARLQVLRRQRLALQRDAQTTRADAAQIEAQLQTDLSQLRRSRAALDQEGTENAARQQLLITAPCAGVVSALHLQAGQTVQAGQSLATLVPENSALEAQLWLPSHKAGFVESGQRVFLRYAAYPYQKFGMHPASVTQVAATPSTPEELPRGLREQLMQQAQASEALYLVRVALDAQALAAYGRSHLLKPGMTLQADVLQEQRAIWEWILEPALAAHQRMRIPSGDPIKASPGGRERASVDKRTADRIFGINGSKLEDHHKLRTRVGLRRSCEPDRQPAGKPLLAIG